MRAVRGRWHPPCRAAVALAWSCLPPLPELLQPFVDVAPRRLFGGGGRFADLAVGQVAREPQQHRGTLLRREIRNRPPQLRLAAIQQGFSHLLGQLLDGYGAAPTC